MSSTEEPSLPPEDGGPIRETADLPRQLFGLPQMLLRVVKTRSLRPLRNYVLVSARLPKGYALESLDELAARLSTDDPDVAAAVLAEAEAIYAEPVDRIESAERRATTLQGAVAVAASVVVAGASLLLDPAKVSGQGWRIVFAALLATLVFCLAACVVRALGATSRAFRFIEPGPQRVADRARMGEPAALTHRAAELLRSSAVADEVGRVKVGLLRSAAWWFRLAICLLAVLAGLLLAYAIAGPQGATGGSARSTTVTTSGTTAATTAK